MTSAQIETADAYEAICGDEPRLLLTCEHASQRLPPGWAWPEEDSWIVGTHWSVDLGAEALTRALAQTLRAPAILARFSRLLIDPNRPLDAPTLLRERAEGRTIRLNAAASEGERERRIDGYYRPYHARIDLALEQRSTAAILSMHTFTPVYEGETRSVEIGVLFNKDAALAERFAHVIRAQGWRTELNEPYSGADGFAFSPVTHGERHQRPALEIEIRQDIAVDPERRAAVIETLRAAVVASYFTPEEAWRT